MSTQVERKSGTTELTPPEMGKFASETIDFVLSQLPSVPQYLRALHDTFTSNPNEPYLACFDTDKFTWRIIYRLPNKTMHLQKTNYNFSRRSLSLEQFPLGTKKADMPLVHPVAITFSSSSIIDDLGKLLEYEKGYITKYEDGNFTEIESAEKLVADNVYNKLMQDLFTPPVRS